MNEILDFKVTDDTFYFYNIDNIITGDNSLRLNHIYEVVLIEDKTLVPFRATFLEITTVYDLISLRFRPLDDSGEIVITTNIFSDENKDWYVLEVNNFVMFKKLHNAFQKKP